MNPVVEKFYAPWELVVLLGFTERMWIGKAESGELPRCTKVFGEWRIPAGSVNEVIDAGRVKAPVVEELGVSARSVGELRRKAGLRRGRFNGGGVE